MHDSIYKKWFYIQKCGVWWGWDKNHEKILRFLPLLSPFYDMEADCFSESENTENKPDLR